MSNLTKLKNQKNPSLALKSSGYKRMSYKRPTMYLDTAKDIRIILSSMYIHTFKFILINGIQFENKGPLEKWTEKFTLGLSAGRLS